MIDVDAFWRTIGAQGGEVIKLRVENERLRTILATIADVASHPELRRDAEEAWREVARRAQQA